MIYRISSGPESKKNESGNKAGNLVEMKKAGFNVPDGIVLMLKNTVYSLRKTASQIRYRS